MIPDTFKSRLFLGILTISSLIILFGCKPNQNFIKKNISIRGSDTMMILAQSWAESYMKKYPDISVRITGGGSGTGIAALLNGTADIANISRELNKREIELAHGKNINLQQTKVAVDGIVIIVHPDNNIDSLTIDEIKGIYSNRIKNWKELGGPDLPIILYGRENSSGTYEFIKNRILGKDKSGQWNNFSSLTQSLQGTAALGEAIARDKGGIGYGGVGHFASRKDLKILKIKEIPASTGVLPVIEGKVNQKVISNGSYPLSRFLYCYSNNKKNEAINDFLDFVVSDEGQKLVEELNYVPLRTMSLQSE